MNQMIFLFTEAMLNGNVKSRMKQEQMNATKQKTTKRYTSEVE